MKKVFLCQNCHARTTTESEEYDHNCCDKPQIVQLANIYAEDENVTKNPGFDPEAEKIILAKAEFAEAYQLILDELDYWMDLPENIKKLVATWIIGTYLHESFNTYPYLFFNAMRGSGKTRLLRLVSCMANKGDGSIQNDMKEAVLFRMERNRVLCIDEFENVGAKDKATLRQVLNSAYKKGLKITRMKKTYQNKEEKFVAEDFEPYFPVAMANIWGMDEVLGDRAITIILEKSSIASKIKLIESFDNNTNFKAIKDKISKNLVSLCHVVTLKTSTTQWNNYIKEKYKQHNDINNTNDTKQHNITNEQLEMFNKIDSKDISGRNFELMFPLLLTANLIHPEKFDEILNILSEVMSNKQSDEFAESKDVSLYDFVSQQTMYRFTPVPIKELTRKFREFIGEESSGEDMWLNEKWIGRALKRLSLIDQTKRLSSGRLVTLFVEKAAEKVLIFKSLMKDEVKK